MPRPQQNRRNQKREPKEYEEDVIQIARVTRVVKGGRRLRFRATVVVGNKKGKVGLGIGKSTEVTGAIKKAISKAKKELVELPLFESGTIAHRKEVKLKSAKVLLIPAGTGTGIIAGGSVRKIMELVGVKNVLSKEYGTTNRITNAQATIKALQELEAEEKIFPSKKKKYIPKEEKRPEEPEFKRPSYKKEKKESPKEESPKKD